MRPYYEDASVTLYRGDCRSLPPPSADVVIADPPYGETSLEWDRWPDEWLNHLNSRALWCFGSLSLFTDKWDEFEDSGWKFSQEIIWEKQNGTNFQNDRFKRVHEQCALFYKGDWTTLYKAVVTTPDAIRRQVRRKRRPPHMGHIEAGAYESHDGGPRMMRSVIYARNCHGFAEHPTQKPFEILQPLIEYACPLPGTVYVPFAGCGSELEAARQLGRRAIGVEINEKYCEIAARRLEQRRARQVNSVFDQIEAR